MNSDYFLKGIKQLIFVMDESFVSFQVGTNSPLDGTSTLPKALCCWVRGIVCTNNSKAMPAAA
jgi:hypothetical protein